jgi:hypothetical protein
VGLAGPLVQLGLDLQYPSFCPVEGGSGSPVFTDATS